MVASTAEPIWIKFASGAAPSPSHVQKSDNNVMRALMRGLLATT
jgi:hypothetical protein